jgi:mxaJ protein
MSSACLDPCAGGGPGSARRACAALVAGAALLLAAAAPAAAADAASAPATALPRTLRVCVDPDNLPYSHANGSGYEPALAKLLADELKLPLQLHWQPMRRGLVRKTLGDGLCDALLTVPKGLDRLSTTRAYYHSSHVLLTRAGDPAPLRSLDDPRLPGLRIGVQLIGDDLAASPPGHALLQRGAVARVVGFTVDGGSADDAGAGPAAQRMAAAVARGQLDAAFAWGPQAGWFAAQAQPPLALQVLAAPPGLGLPFEFGMAIGVRRGETAWRDRLQAALDARQVEIDALLDRWRVPRVAAPAAPPAGSSEPEAAR